MGIKRLRAQRVKRERRSAGRSPPAKTWWSLPCGQSYRLDGVTIKRRLGYPKPSGPPRKIASSCSVASRAGPNWEARSAAWHNAFT